MHIEERNGRWRARVFHEYERISRTFASRKDAEEWSAKAKATLLKGGKVERTKRRRTVLEDNVFYPPDFKVMSAGEILALAKTLIPVCGLYFLIHQGKIVYVGQSVDVHTRLAYHRKRFTFDAVHIVECDRKDVGLMESAYIATLKPKHNRANGRWRPLDIPT